MTHPNHPSVDPSDRVVPYNLRQSGRTPTELLISTRVRKSPFWHLSHEAGCWRATIYNRIYHPRGYVKPEDGGAMVEYEALVNRVTMWNVAVERQIRVKGPDAEAFTDYVITRDATKIEPMHGKYAILCNEKGGILNDPVLLRLSEDEFWFSISDSDLLLWLQGVNVAKKYNIDPSQLANQFVTTRPFVTSNIIGATSMKQLKLAVTSIEINLTEEIEKEIEKAFQKHGNGAS